MLRLCWSLTQSPGPLCDRSRWENASGTCQSVGAWPGLSARGLESVRAQAPLEDQLSSRKGEKGGGGGGGVEWQKRLGSRAVSVSRQR